MSPELRGVGAWSGMGGACSRTGYTAMGRLTPSALVAVTLPRRLLFLEL